MSKKLNESLRKLSIKIRSFDMEKIPYFLDKYENISIFPENDILKIELYLPEDKFSTQILKDLDRDFGSYKSSVIESKNWVKKNISVEKEVKTELFLISQGIKTKSNEKKYRLYISALNSFGTGSHESTFLAIRNLEYLIKRNNFTNILDMGTGTGILSFILRKITYRKIIAIDIDEISRKSFLNNLKINNLNNIFFQISNGFKNKYLKREKFDLIVSNMLLNFQNYVAKSFSLKLKKNGFLVLSGILIVQENEIIVKFSKYKFRLLKKIYMGNWVSLTFTKKSF